VCGRGWSAGEDAAEMQDDRAAEVGCQRQPVEVASQAATRVLGRLHGHGHVEHEHSGGHLRVQVTHSSSYLSPFPRSDLLSHFFLFNQVWQSVPPRPAVP
jgi:hypothetical protein